MLNGLFDIENRLAYLIENGDMLPNLKELVQWEKFRRDLEVIYDHDRKSNAGRRPFDVVMMFKILILQSLYNLSDDEMEYQIMDRLSFMRFLDMALDSRVPCAKRGMPSGGHHSPTAFIFWVNPNSKKIPLPPHHGASWADMHQKLYREIIRKLSPNANSVLIPVK